LAQIPSVDLHDFYHHCWMTLTFDPVTFSISPVSCRPCDD